MNARTLVADRRRRKMITLLWALLLTVTVVILIYKELTALLYILCTLGVAALLIIVAFSDLAHDDHAGSEVAQATDAAGVARRER